MDIKKIVTEFVANDELEAALEALEAYIKHANSEYLSKIAVLKGNLTDIRNKSILGVLESREEQVQRNKIRLSIVQFAENIDKIYTTNHVIKEPTQKPKPLQKIRLLSILGVFAIIVTTWRMYSFPELSLDYLYTTVDAPIPDRDVQPETKPSILPKKHSNAQKTKPEPQPIGPNYGNQNNAPVGGNLTQTIITNPAPRNLTWEQTNEILSSIPKGYIVEIKIQDTDLESEGFSEQIQRLLSKSDRTSFTTLHPDIRSEPGASFKIEPYPDKPNAMILTIYSQK